MGEPGAAGRAQQQATGEGHGKPRTGDRGRGRGCRVPRLMIQLYHSYDTATVGLVGSGKRSPLRHAATPRATRAASPTRGWAAYIAGGAAARSPRRPLVRQLAAQLRGCRWCIEHGLHRWRKAFLPVAELGALRYYAASPFFSSRERAALAFTVAVSAATRPAGGH